MNNNILLLFFITSVLSTEIFNAQILEDVLNCETITQFSTVLETSTSSHVNAITLYGGEVLFKTHSFTVLETKTIEDVNLVCGTIEIEGEPFKFEESTTRITECEDSIIQPQTFTSSDFVVTTESSDSIEESSTRITDFESQTETFTSSDFVVTTEFVEPTENANQTFGIEGDLMGYPCDNEGLFENQNIVDLNENQILDLRDKGVDYCNVVGLGDFIANGTQQLFEVCSTTVLGSIPNINNMPSTIILNPKNNDNICIGTDFTVKIKTINMDFGFFDDPSSLYYLSPQNLNENGIIKGHSHVAIQKLNFDEVPEARDPVFFKGLNGVGEDGVLETAVSGELFTEKGEYRLCTSTASQGHQPVLAPVARRGFQDDCIRFHIV